MDVELYIYDLSRGLARNISAALLGTQIDAVYHTSIVFGGVEYVYDGGIKMINPAKSHLGKPMQIMKMGQTELPMDVIQEYLESLRSIYTAEAYDLWSHNCNNFSNDFATFLIGTGIPDRIQNLPAAVLQTPFGRMLQPRINEMVRAQRQSEYGGSLLGLADDLPASKKPKSASSIAHQVKQPIGILELNRLLEAARPSCAIIFFTSQTCGPCRQLYSQYAEMAEEAGPKATLIKVDIDRSFDIAAKYEVRVTPTFITYLHGTQENRWQGGGSSTLRGNFNLLLQMAWPAHTHSSLPLPTLIGASTSPVVLFTKCPPIPKLLAKMGESTSSDPAIQEIANFITSREKDGAAEAPLPDLDAFSVFLREQVPKLPIPIIFTIIDLLRIALSDPRFSGYFAEEKDHRTIGPLLSYINSLPECPYALRLVALQTTCNLFSTPLYPDHILNCEELRRPIMGLVTTSLLDDSHPNVRVAAASLCFNLTVHDWKLRTEQHRKGLPDEDAVELVAGLLEAIKAEGESGVEGEGEAEMKASPEALRGFLLGLGFALFCVNEGAEVVDCCRAMDAKGVVLGKRKGFKNEALVGEIGDVLLGRGLGLT